MTSDGVHSYTFNAEGMITAVDGGDIQYIYDADGDRVRKVVDGRADDLIWMFGKLLAEKRADGTWVDYIYANGQRIASVAQAPADKDDKVPPPVTTYFLTDTLGVTRVALSQTAKVVAAGFFAPFGEEIREKATRKGEGIKAESISYSDEIHDAETGLDAYHYRSYNPKLGRWMSPDPSSEHYSRLNNPQTFNLYAYVTNDPLKYLDQLGLYEDDSADYASNDCWVCDDGFAGGDNVLLSLDGGGGGGGGADDPNQPVYDPTTGQYVLYVNALSTSDSIDVTTDPTDDSVDPGAPVDISATLPNDPINPFDTPSTSGPYFAAYCKGAGLMRLSYSCAYACGAVEVGAYPSILVTVGGIVFSPKQIVTACPSSAANIFCPSSVTVEGNVSPASGKVSNINILSCAP